MFLCSSNKMLWRILPFLGCSPFLTIWHIGLLNYNDESAVLGFYTSCLWHVWTCWRKMCQQYLKQFLQMVCLYCFVGSCCKWQRSSQRSYQLHFFHMDHSLKNGFYKGYQVLTCIRLTETQHGARFIEAQSSWNELHKHTLALAELTKIGFYNKHLESKEIFLRFWTWSHLVSSVWELTQDGLERTIQVV